MKTYLLILGLSTALTTGLPGPGGQRSTCERLVFRGRAQALSLKDDALRIKVKRLLARAEKQCRAGKSRTGVTMARSAIDLIK